MRYLIIASLLLSCSLCLAEDFPKNTNDIKSLTAEQVPDLVMVVTHVRKSGAFVLNGLSSIDKDVAQELAKFKGGYLSLNGLTSIDKPIARELAKFKGKNLDLKNLTSIDELSLLYLKSNPRIVLPDKYLDKKD